MQNDLNNTRKEYHTSIRKNKKSSNHLSFRNNVQLAHTINFVQQLEIDFKKPVKRTIEQITDDLEDHLNDVDSKRIQKDLFDTLKLMRLGNDNIKNIVVSRLPTTISTAMQLLIDIKQKINQSEDRNKSEQLIKYIFLKLQQHIKTEQLQTSVQVELKKLINFNDLLDVQNNVNSVLYFFATVVLDGSLVDSFFNSECLANVFLLIKKYIQHVPDINEFKNKSISVLCFLKSFITIYKNVSAQYPLPEDIKYFIEKISQKVISNSDIYLTQVHNKVPYIMGQQVLHAFYIYQALSKPELMLNQLPLQGIKQVFDCRYRQYNVFKYIMKMLLKVIRTSEEACKQVLKSQCFVQIVKLSQRIHYKEVNQILLILLDYDGAQKALKAATIVLILDLTNVVKHIKDSSFRVLFKYFEKLRYSTQTPQARICLRKIAENIEPYSNFQQQLIFWRELVINGYQSYVPRYMKDPLYDLLTPEEIERQNHNMAVENN